MSGSGTAAGETAWDALARAAAEPPPASASALPRELLAFEVASESYAVPVERVREIVRLRAVTPMPRVPAAVRGVISLRGEVIQVIDLRRRLGLPPGEPGRRARIVVIHGEDGQLAGLLVDAVREVLRLPEEAVQPPPPGETRCVVALCQREGEFVSLVDLDRVLQLDADG